MLLVLTSVASASPPEPAFFTITGFTESYYPTSLPSGRTKFQLTANGYVTEHCKGIFHYDESGTVHIDPETGTGSGNSRGTMTITSDASKAIIRFRGQTTITGMISLGEFPFVVPEGTAKGTFTVLDGTGTYAVCMTRAHMPASCRLLTSRLKRISPASYTSTRFPLTRDGRLQPPATTCPREQARRVVRPISDGLPKHSTSTFFVPVSWLFG
jgi:hypothetical protein